MFNGIIFSTGVVEKIFKAKNSYEVVLKTKFRFKKSDIGSSIACNGTCLTLIKINGSLITFYLKGVIIFISVIF